jgi:hypothetical protein
MLKLRSPLGTQIGGSKMKESINGVAGSVYPRTSMKFAAVPMGTPSTNIVTMTYLYARSIHGIRM